MGFLCVAAQNLYRTVMVNLRSIFVVELSVYAESSVSKG